jgi:hypothetical protein
MANAATARVKANPKIKAYVLDLIESTCNLLALSQGEYKKGS